MTERQPRSAENIANQYDDDQMQPADRDAVILWEEARDRLARPSSTYWLASTRSDGRPHVRPILAVMMQGVLYTTSSLNARKAKNLSAYPHFSCSVSTGEIDFIVEGVASPVTDQDMLEKVAEAYHTVWMAG